MPVPPVTIGPIGMLGMTAVTGRKLVSWVPVSQLADTRSLLASSNQYSSKRILEMPLLSTSTLISKLSRSLRLA
jgi:hypothetical protein